MRPQTIAPAVLICLSLALSAHASQILYTFQEADGGGHLGSQQLGYAKYTISVLADTSQITATYGPYGLVGYSVPTESMTIDLVGSIQVTPFSTAPFSALLTATEPTVVTYIPGGLIGITTADIFAFPTVYNIPVANRVSGWDMSTPLGPVSVSTLVLGGLNVQTDQGQLVPDFPNVGQTFQATLVAADAPEPDLWAMTAVGLAIIGAVRRSFSRRFA